MFNLLHKIARASCEIQGRVYAGLYKGLFGVLDESPNLMNVEIINGLRGHRSGLFSLFGRKCQVLTYDALLLHREKSSPKECS